MKNLLATTVALLLLCPFLGAQKTFKKSFSASTAQKVQIEVANADLKVVGYNGAEVVIEVADYDAPPERAKGLKPLSANGTDNTGIGLEVQEAGGVMTIRKTMRSDADYAIKIPAGASLRIEESGWESSDFRVDGVNGDIEVEANNADINLKEVSGPIVAKSTNGDIDIVFSSVNQAKPTHVSATNGHIDVTAPAGTKANLSMSTINGETYTDFDVKLPDAEKGMRKLGGYKMKGTINGGGVEITLNAINDDIYLRKKQ